MTQKKITSNQLDQDLNVSSVTADSVVVNSGGLMNTPVFTVDSIFALTGATITIGDDVNLSSGNALTVNNVAVPTISSTSTLTNKRITPRIGTTTSSATITPVGNSNDAYTVTALGTGATIAAPTGTPTDTQKIVLRIKDNGTARTLTWNAIYRPIGVTLPTTTVAGKTLYVGMVYNSTDSAWDVLSVAQQT